MARDTGTARAGRSGTGPAPAPATARPARKPPAGRDEPRAPATKREGDDAAPRGGNREAGRSAAASAARIAELEDRVTALEREVARLAEPGGSGRGRPGRRGREIDPGDAVPPGVAVLEPEPLDGEAEAAKESLEQHLREG